MRVEAKVCPRCGLPNAADFLFCPRCRFRWACPQCAYGYEIALAAEGIEPPPPPFDEPSGIPLNGRGPPPDLPYRAVKRTKTGLLLLTIAAGIMWIPRCGSVAGGLPALVGAILVILGRRAFGRTHARCVVAASVLYVFGLFVAISLAVLLAIAIASGDPLRAQSALSALSTVSVAAVAITGLAWTLLPYALQKPIGRTVLWAGFVANAVLSAVLYLYVEGKVAAIPPGTVWLDLQPLYTLGAELEFFQMFMVIPYLLWMVGYYLGWRRIDRGEIPRARRLTAAPAILHWHPAP